MRDDRPSTTAVYVAMGRALADARREVPGFCDPYAVRLLPEDYREVVERLLAHAWPRSGREALLRGVAVASEKLLGPRTVEIDDALRDLPPGCQVVLLGAGLDARAYRMPELAGSVVFEVDHPASQAAKRGLAAGLQPVCTDLRYVPVDFARDALSDVLARAGHLVDVPTAWVFEGVITYLTPREGEDAIAAMASRSARGSRLAATYNKQNWMRGLFSRATASAAEPFRTSFTPEAMAGLLGRYGFVVVSDRDGLERARRLGLVRRADRFLRFHRVVVAKVP